MTRSAQRAAAAGTFLLLSAARLYASEPLDLFNNEDEARSYCRGDSVVWLDVPEKTYWSQNQRGYGGKPRDGGYTCHSDAVRTGNRASAR